MTDEHRSDQQDEVEGHLFREPVPEVSEPEKFPSSRQDDDEGTDEDRRPGRHEL